MSDWSAEKTADDARHPGHRGGGRGEGRWGGHHQPDEAAAGALRPPQTQASQSGGSGHRDWVNCIILKLWELINSFTASLEMNWECFIAVSRLNVHLESCRKSVFTTSTLRSSLEEMNLITVPAPSYLNSFSTFISILKEIFVPTLTTFTPFWTRREQDS